MGRKCCVCCRVRWCVRLVKVGGGYIGVLSEAVGRARRRWRVVVAAGCMSG